MLAPETAIALSQLGALSPDGQCRTFDAEANGFVRAEGGGVVIIKRLSDALRDGDPIYCVIRGSAVNNDGASNGLTAPNPKAQESVIRDACRNAGITPASVHYVETHGTGTPIGDPIEASSLGAVYGAGRPAERPLLIGSAKTNIGHLEAAAGMTGIIKVALSLKHSLLPPNLHFQRPNSSIDFENLRLKVVTELRKWPVAPGERRRGAVSAFGLGGTNGHIVLEDVPKPKTLLFFAGESAADLQANIREAVEGLDRSESTVKELAQQSVENLNHPHRLAVTGESVEDLKEQLEGTLANQYGRGVFHLDDKVLTANDPVWVFSGVGSQWLGMGLGLMADEPAFRSALERCAREIKLRLGWSLFDELTADKTFSQLDRIDVLWPTLVSLQVALTEQWRALGITPAAVIGHSLGEVAAAYAAGVFTLEESITLACHWGRLVERSRGNGAMALVGFGWDEAGELIAPFGDRLARGVNSSPSTTILSGDGPALDEVVKQVTERGLFGRRIAVTIAAHSSRMAPAVEELPQLLEALRPRRARVPLMSTNVADFISGEEMNGSYWQRQLCEPVRFAEGISCLIAAGHTLFLECSPHPIVDKAIAECLAHSEKKGKVVASLYRDEHEGTTLYESLATLYVHGATLNSAGSSDAGETSTDEPTLLLPVSGRKEQAKRDYAVKLADYLERSQDVSLTDLCYTASVRRTAHPYRAAVVGRTRNDFVKALRAIGAGDKHPAVTSGRARSLEPGPVAFIFPGQGSQWHGMARQLLAQEPVFRQTLEECDAAIRKYTDWSVLDELSADVSSSALHRVDVVQPTLFAIAVGLAALWRSWGIAPAAVVGHSMGEAAASYVAGALSLDNAARIICLRSKLLRRVSGQGAMAVTDLPRAQAEQYLSGYEDRVSIAVCNSPSSTVLSGEPAALDEILATLEAQDIFCRRVKVDVASHSPQMDPLREDLLTALCEIEPHSGVVPIYSTVNGEVCDGSQFDATYWVSNLRKPVQFVGAIEALMAAGFRAFIEISPHPLLSGNIREILKHHSEEGTVVSSLRRDEDERATLLSGLATLHCVGQAVDFASLYHDGGRVVTLPTYAWQRERHWLEPAKTAEGSAKPKELEIAKSSSNQTDPLTAEKASSAARLYFHNNWIEAPLSNEADPTRVPGSILILGSDHESLKQGRASLSAEDAPVVLVKPGAGYRELGSLTFEINPQRQADYQRLIDELALQKLLPGRIVYSWSDPNFPNDPNALQAQLERGAYSVLYLSQALIEHKPVHDIQLWYIYQTGPTEVLPQHAALSGSFKTIRQENPSLVFKTVEIRAAKSATTTGDSIWEVMSREIGVRRDHEFEIRYEAKRRFTRRLQEVELEDKTHPAQHDLTVKPGGVYLITGGAGGLGLLFAEHLAQKQRVTLVLTGRSPLNAAKTTLLERLKSLGAQVSYIQSDISKRDQVESLVGEIKSRFGAISGVLHVAGVLQRTFLSKKTTADVASVLSPKVYGTLHLDEVLKDQSLDFFILFSSISAVKGYEGLFDYAYGNSFMDHFAEWRENLRAQRHRAGRTISINWSLWQDGGMQLAPDEAALFLEQTGLEVLTSREGTRLLGVCATQSSVSQCLVGYGDRAKFTEFLEPVSVQPATANESITTTTDLASSTPTASVDTTLLREKIEAYLKSKLGDVTGLPADEFDAQERFIAYGIDSVIVHRFNAKIAKDLGPVSKTLLFENRNIEELTNYFAANRSAAFIKLFGLQKSESQVEPVKVSQAVVAAVPEKIDELIPEVEVGENDIAIIGLAGRYPHARNIDEFWENLKTGVDCIDEIRSDRWDYRKFYDPNPEKSSEGKTYSKWAGMLDDVDKFDPLFFNLSTKEAQSMDPQERLFLETAWTAFEDAGYSRTRLRRYVQKMNGVDVGVFVGCTSNTHMLLGPDEWAAGNYTLPLSMPWSIANRVSHVLDLHGPSMPIDTGCAASLTAIHLACESLKRGECSMALAGGVNLVLHPSKLFYPSQYRMLSPTGRCQAFGQTADGIVLGEGAGAIVLKPLREAVRDRDHIYAVVRSTAGNHGGQVHGYTVPNPRAQASLILQSLRSANIDARSVSCIEAHGTGTSLGDPIEVAGLNQAFREHTSETQYCALGSVKSNIGHLEGAAGIAGLTKLLLQMKHHQLVPSLHAETVNPDINFGETPFYVRSELTEWERPVVTEKGARTVFPRRAGVSSFGAGGSNAHVLVEEFEPSSTVAPAAGGSHLFLLSAGTEERLRVSAGLLASSLEQRQIANTNGDHNGPQPADIAYTLQVGREALEERLAIIGSTTEDLIHVLRAFLRDEQNSNEWRRSAVRRSSASKDQNIDGQLERGRLEPLMEAWLQGIEIDWSRLAQNAQRRAVSLPTYPFLRERVWIHDRDVLCEAPRTAVINRVHTGLHPLIDSNESTLSEQRFRKVLTGDEFYLRDHRVGRHLVLPGVAIAEMARAAGEIVAERKVRQIKNIVFSSPVSVATEPRAFYVGLQPDGESLGFQVYSVTEDRQKTIHTQGKLIFEPQATGNDGAQYIDPEAIRQRCGTRVQAADGYALLNDLGLQLGASFQPNHEIHSNATEAISRLELPNHLKDEFGAFVLHPTLMDGAQQISGLTNLLGSQDRIRVPFAIGEIEILGPLTQVCYAHITLTGGPAALHSENRRFDISLADETGKVQINIKQFQTRAFIARFGEGVQALDMTSHHAVAEPFYFQTKWERSDLPEADLKHLNGTVLLFDTGDEVRDALRADLQAHAGAKANIILVKPGKNYRSFGDLGYAIDPRNPDDYQRLFDELQNRNRTPETIIHLWSRNHFNSGTESLTAQLDESLYSIFHISQTLLRRELSKQTQLLYAYGSSLNEPQPLYAGLRGFLSTLQRESPKLICKTLELRQASPAGSSVDSTATRWAELLVGELSSSNPGNVEVRYEEGQRQLHRLEELHRDNPTVTVSRVDGTGLKQEGVYLLTGGMGGLGLIFAEHLARKFKAKLVLTGRSDIGPEQLAKLDQLQSFGGEAIYVKADVSRREDVAGLIAQAKAQFGRIDGVIHSAGVTRDAFVRNKKRADIETVLAPKVFGTIYLDEALADENLDFFVMFSSTTALLGQIGLSDYGYANRFMDQFAEWRSLQRAAGKRHGKTLAINWPLWRDGGMRLNEQTEELLFTSTGMRAMTTAAGVAAFERALAGEDSQLFVIDGERSRINKALNLSNDGAAPAPLENDSTERDDSQISSLLEKDLVKIVSALLKISGARISLDKNLSDFGFDSVSLVEFSNQLNRKYQLEITPAIFFEYPSLSAFSGHLLSDYYEAMARSYPGSSTSSPSDRAAETVPPRTPEATFPQDRFQTSAPESVFQPAVVQNVKRGHSSETIKEPIAIIGMSGVMPQSEDLDTFWRHLEEGHDLIREIPEDRWDWKAYDGNPTAEANKTNIKWGGFINDVDKFDARFFGISRREADFMDPQQRVFLETVWKAIEDAGYKPSELSGRKIGVYAGVGGLDYGELMRDSGVAIEAYSTTGVFHCILANRVSYLLNLTGPSVPVDTGCSSALVAIRQAIEAMWSGSCEMAIAGGVNTLLSPSVFISFSKAGMLSLDGRCKTFDKAANGYVRAEGAGVVLLKPLSKAIADRDNIHAIIRGSAINHGGRVNTLTAPNPNAQAELIKSAFAEGDIAPDTVTYIEAHGTGTSLGDPIEINGLKKAFREMFQEGALAQPDQPFCGVGSVKTNTGHLETAAAMAGIFKVILAMKHKKIPATIHFSEINPYIQLENTPLYLVTKNCDWERRLDANKRELPRRAGVSSFGFGGMSGHLVLEEFIPEANEGYQPESDISGPEIIVLSARNQDRLKDYAARLAEFLAVRCAGTESRAQQLPADGNLLPLLRQELLLTAASILDVTEKDIDPDESFTECGFDQVHLSKLAERVSEQYKLSVPSTTWFSCQDLTTLAVYLWDEHRDHLISHFHARNDKALPRPVLADVAYTLQIGREAMAERLAFVAGSSDDLIAKLRAYSKGNIESEGLYTGNVEKEDSALDHVLNGAEGAEFMRLLVQGRKLEKLAQLWVSGIDVAWKTLLPTMTARRISLTTYPFARDRYWFPLPAAKPDAAVNKALHPLVDELDLSLSQNGKLVFRKSLKRTEPIVAQHNVGGQLVLPGVGHLLMALAAISNTRETDSFELNRVLWLRPLVVTGESRGVQVTVREENGALPYEVRSGGEVDTVTHSTGTLLLTSKPVNSERLSIEKIKSRCDGGWNKEWLYRRFSQTGVTLGNYFQTLEQAWANSEELLASVRLPSEYQEELKDYFVHPTMLDGALQAMGPLWLARHGDNSGPLLPFAIGKVEFLHPLGASGYVYVKVAGEQSFNAALLDEAGRVCIKLHEVTLRESKAKASEPVSVGEEGFYYRPFWQAMPLETNSRPPTQRGTALIIRPFDDFGLGAALLDAHGNHDVFEICLGAENRQLSPTSWEIATADDTALDDCIRQMSSIDQVYFLGGIQTQPIEIDDLKAFEEIQERGLMSLFRLVKALGARFAQAPLKLTVLTNDVHRVASHDAVKPYAAGVLGFAKSVANEYPRWTVQCVDTSRDEITRPDLIKAITAETDGGRETEIALRAGQRYVRMIQPVTLPPVDKMIFRHEGVYLIVGGAGGIGLELSKYLAKTAQARLVLVGRGALNDEQRRQIEIIESLGASVQYVRADAADLKSMRGAVEQARASFGPIHGVIHSALVLKDKTVETMTEEEFRAALLPKVQGSVNLYLAVADEALDFMLFFSSAQSFSGNAGQSNYAAGCTFKDGFADYLRQVVPYEVKTINWGYWGEVGVVASAAYNRRLAALGARSISTSEGLAAVHNILATDLIRCLPSMPTSVCWAGWGPIFSIELKCIRLLGRRCWKQLSIQLLN
jgi:acyl transferase domain-containing protein/aryl carrier-like protein